MPDFAHRAIRLLEDTHPLDRVPRAGYLLRGVTEPESVAAHSYSLALLALLFVEQYPQRFDRHKTLIMAIVHDAAEARMMDIPMPVCTAELKTAKNAAERAILEDMFAGLPGVFLECSRELEAGVSPEARLIKALDKAQMMIKVGLYEAEGRGRLGEFWTNPANFNDYGLEPVGELFDAICARAGKPRPRA